MRASLSIPALVFCLALASPLKADVASGWQAYLEGDYPTALSELTSASEAGEAAAQYYLGVLYSHGEAVARNYRTAARWYEKAASQGHSDAQFNLGLLYYKASGRPGLATSVDRAPDLAARWFERAADDGHPMAAYLLCQLVDNGRVSTRDAERALALCRLAADAGIAGAQFNTGLLLAELSAEIATWREAYTWFLLARRANYPGAQQNLEALARHLNDTDIAVARAAADAWQPSPPSPAS